MENILEMPSVKDYNDNLGVTTLHPLVSVVDMSELECIRHSLKHFGFYCIILKHLGCGDVAYGRSTYDYNDGSLVFVAPNQMAGANDGKISYNTKGWILMFHPDLLRNTYLEHSMNRYTFFDYSSNEALHLSEQEREIIIGYLCNIRRELHHPTDDYTNRNIILNIEALLNNCMRFYERQFISRKNENNKIMEQLTYLLEEYLLSGKSQQYGLPTVAWCADNLHLSSNYFGDLVKKYSGRSAQEYIKSTIVDYAKLLLANNSYQVNEIAYKLGFKYHQHFSRLFKHIEGVSASQYRSTK
jgi:AraC-like DNA-binding protein